MRIEIRANLVVMCILILNADPLTEIRCKDRHTAGIPRGHIAFRKEEIENGQATDQHHKSESKENLLVSDLGNDAGDR